MLPHLLLCHWAEVGQGWLWGSIPPTLPKSAKNQLPTGVGWGEWLCREPGSAGDCSSSVPIHPSQLDSLPAREMGGGEPGRDQML